jgi:hypothetical protein
MQAGNAASDDELEDIWWPDIHLNFSIVNWILPEMYMYIILVGEGRTKDIVHHELWSAC